MLDKMPAAMRKDVDAAIAELPPGKKQPSRWTRREAVERAAHIGEAQPMDVDGGEGGEGPAAAAPEEEPVRAVLLASACRLLVVLLAALGGAGGMLLPTLQSTPAAVLLSPALPEHCICAHRPRLQEGDAYEFATPVDILAPLGKAQLTCDDDPPLPFWEALEHKKWGLRKVRCCCALLLGGGMRCGGRQCTQQAGCS